MSGSPVAQAVAQCLTDHELAGRSVTVGLSGGLDSVVLLHALANRASAFPLNLSALHVHHGLSPNADQWTEHCAALCDAWQVSLRVVRVSIDPHDPRGIESAARAARYEAYEAEPADAVALAHHADDQAETVLLQLLRGAGPPGLAAMPAQRRLRSGALLVRPFLDVPRPALLEYAVALGLVWVEDDSNTDDRYRRNALRLHLMPVLDRHFAGYRTTLGRVARNAADAAHLAEVLGRVDLAACEVPGGLSVARLAALDPVRRANVVRTWLRGQAIDPPRRDSLLEGLTQMVAASDNARPELRFCNHRLMRHRDRLCLVGAAPAEVRPWRFVWCGETSFTLPDGRCWTAHRVTGAGVRASSLGQGEITLTPRTGGERLRIANNRPRRSLKNLLQEAGLPAWERERLVIVRRDGIPLHVPGLGTEPDHAAAVDEAGWVFEPADPASLGAP